MTDSEIRKVVEEELNNIAPEADLAGVDPEADLREAIDIDSMDFLNFITAIHHRLGINIPELDYRSSSRSRARSPTSRPISNRASSESSRRRARHDQDRDPAVQEAYKLPTFGSMGLMAISAAIISQKRPAPRCRKKEVYQPCLPQALKFSLRGSACLTEHLE